MAASPLRTRTIRANGLEFGVLETGPARGPLALCLHGFPDSAHTWRHLLPELAAAGFYAVAPFMRGYAPTGIPADREYGVGALAADAIALHAALGGAGDAVLIGHDWGAEAAYAAAARAPDRWRRLVTLAVPPARLDELLFSDYEQLKRFFYIFMFRDPAGFAETLVAADDMAFLDTLWRDWSPAYNASAELAHVKQCLRDPARLTAAISYYRAAEPAQTAATPPRNGPPSSRRRSRRSTCTAPTTGASRRTWLAARGTCLPRTRRLSFSRTLVISSSWRGLTKSARASSPG